MLSFSTIIHWHSSLTIAIYLTMAASSFASCSVLFFLVLFLCGFGGCISSEIGLGSRLLASDGQTWVSDNGTFAFGFSPSVTDDRLFELGIWFAKLPGDRTLVWSANR